MKDVKIARHCKIIPKHAVLGPMAGKVAKTSESQPKNDNEPDAELVDRLRRAALGDDQDVKSQRSAQMAFDPALDLERRMLVIAGLSEDSMPPTRKARPRIPLSWLPIPLGISAVIFFGGHLTRSESKPQKKIQEERSEPQAPLPDATGSAPNTALDAPSPSE